MPNKLAYQDEQREELIDGKLAAMSPWPSTNHNRVAGNIFRILSTFLEGHKCESFAGGEVLFLSEKDTFIPDGMVICDPDKVAGDGVHGAPDLVVEVISSSTVKNDRCYKMDAYAQYGVREYWIVSPNEKHIEQYLLQNGSFVLHDVYIVYPPYMLTKMTEEERSKVVKEFKCGIFDNLTIKIEDVFKRLK